MFEDSAPPTPAREVTAPPAARLPAAAALPLRRARLRHQEARADDAASPLQEFIASLQSAPEADAAPPPPKPPRTFE